MPVDFRASQVQTNKIISSGSTGTNAKLVVYDIAQDDTSSPNQGNVNSSFSSSSIGTDIFLYVSGTVATGSSTSRVTTFGGSVVVSGAVGFSNASYIVLNGSDLRFHDTTNPGGYTLTQLAATGSGGGSDVDWTDGGGQLKTTSSVAITSDNLYAGSYGSDVYFYVSGANEGGAAAVFGGDVHVSGNLEMAYGLGLESINANGSSKLAILGVLDATSLGGTLNDVVLGDYNGGSGGIIVWTGGELVAYLTQSNSGYFSGSYRFPQGLSGSITRLTDGSSYLVAGTNVTITSASNGSVTISSTGGGSSEQSPTNFVTATDTSADATPKLIWSLPLSSSTVYDVDATIIAAGTGSGITRRFKRNFAAMNYASTGSFMQDSIFVPVLDVTGSAAASSLDVGFIMNTTTVEVYITGAASETINWRLTAQVVSSSGA